MKTIHFICLIFVIVIFSKCNTKTKKNEGIDSVSVKKISGVLVAPESLELYKPFNANFIDSNKIAIRPLKIYTFVDTSCLTSINNWSKTAKDLKEYNIPIIMICQSEDNFELLKHLCETKEISAFPFPFYFDHKNKFFILNKFLDRSPNNHTVLTDKNNKILLSGDLTLSEQIKQSYIEIIKAYTN